MDTLSVHSLVVARTAKRKRRMMPTVTLSAKDHETLLFAALDCAATSLEMAHEECLEVRDASPREGGLVEEARTSIRLAREALDALDALGWPQRQSVAGGNY